MRVSGLFPAVQTAAPRPTKPKRKAEKYAEKSMHLINKKKKEQRKKGKERCTTNTKKYAERAWPCGRAASGRVAWREALKKYAPKSAGKTCCRAGFQLLPRIKYAPDARKNGADGRSAAYKTKRKGKKKQKKGASGPKATA